jgi:secretion/DNA translocation related CpaE-like protein
MTETPRPLLITTDPLLLDEVLRLATAAGTEVSVRDEPTASAWSAAPLVLVGDDALAAATDRALPRRDAIVVVRRSDGHGSDATPSEVWRAAVAVGAEHVAELPDASRWIVDRLAQSSDGTAEGGPVISCVSAAGGAGSSTLAALLARESSGLLIDVDPFGAAIPVDGGVRWPDLTETRGRIPPTSLRNALPSVHGVRVLTGTSNERFTIPVHALSSVIEAGARGFTCTVIDTPRADAEASRTAWSRSDVVVVVLGPHPSTVMRAPALIDAVREVCTHVAIVARTSPRDPGTWCLAESVEWGLPALPAFRHDRALAQGEHAYFTARSTARRNARDILGAVYAGIRR